MTIESSTAALAALRDRLLVAMGALERGDYDVAIREIESGTTAMRALIEELREAA